MLNSEGPFPECSEERYGTVAPSIVQPLFSDADESYLPLVYVCRWQDGHSIDTVPGYMNPVVMTLAAATVLATAIAVRRRPT
ncbi:hypothetical protein [Streptomyces sp. NPDC127098]|uniref:hypothetical protein n=1 Tax=Streptomyces sp. NPDC127098 TaxID=3347137 RepID=UPI003653D10E